MKRLSILSFALVLGALLIPQSWVSLGAPNVSGSVFRSLVEPQRQAPPERLASLDQVESLPVAQGGEARIARDPRQWRELLASKLNQRFQDLFPGVDLIFAGSKQRLEAVLIVKPGVDPASVRFDFPQAEALSADAQGNVWVAMQGGDLGFLRPSLTRKGESVHGSFVAQGGRIVLQVPEHDPAQSLLVRFDVVFPTRPVNLLDQILSRTFKAEHYQPTSPASPEQTTMLTATKMVDNATSTPGGALMYTVTITNTGATTANGVTFTDTIDPNTTIIAGSLNAQPIANADSYNVIGNVRIQPNAAQGLLANDCDPTVSGCTISGLTITAMAGDSTAPFSGTTSNGGQVTSSATDGSFVYNPAPGFSGTDTFSYTVRDEGADGIPGNADDKTDTATVTLSVSTPIWFIDDSASPGGDGRLTAPYNSIAAFNPAAADDPGDAIFLFAGSYTGPLPLKDNQKLIGQGASTTLAGILGLTAETYSDALPALNNTQSSVTITTTVAATDAITLGVNNLLRGFTVGDTTGSDITGTSFGTLAITEVTLNGTGRALNLTMGSFAAGSAITSIVSTSGAEGITLSAITGANSPTIGATTISGSAGNGLNINASSTPFTFSSATIDNTGAAGIALTNNTGAISIGGSIGATNDPTGNDVTINQGNANVTISATLTKSSTGRIADVTNRTGGTVGFSGALSCSSGCTGVNLNTNTGSTINFTGGMSLNTGANPAFTATGGGTVTATQDNTTIINTLTTTTGTGLNVANTSIGGSGLTFRSINTNGATSGIILNNTGTGVGNGGLTVTGNSAGMCGGSVTNTTTPGTPATVTAPVTADCTGGTIQASTGAGISLTSTKDVSLTRV
ncbi:MAG: DUF11 domain-containing protein, partial [Acidobacteria bacterium]|nr:DUF11 domain-containing protein [Acidobacteriota bacterium]